MGNKNDVAGQDTLDSVPVHQDDEGRPNWIRVYRPTAPGDQTDQESTDVYKTGCQRHEPILCRTGSVGMHGATDGFC